MFRGIFTGSADIKHLLPTETQRFNNINAEFLALMKKVSKSPFVLDVLNIAGVQKSLERLADLLAKIQKALGEYLERERQSFPRFYFVGDEDLLEIIGNSKDVGPHSLPDCSVHLFLTLPIPQITRVGKFLKKMFAGLSSLSLDSEESQIEGMASREGETIPFAAPIVLAEYPKINDWLARLEEEMKRSLAGTLQLAHRDLKAFFLSSDALDGSRLLAWIDQYPAQLVVLAVQIAWTSLVEGSLASEAGLSQALSIVLRTLDLLADAVLGDLPVVTRRKCEHLITELVHERDVIRRLEEDGIRSSADFDWLYHMRFYLDETRGDLLEQLEVRMASAKFSYGFEYLGVPDRLVQTPLTDRCYLTLTQALDARLGGSPFGPAGTGTSRPARRYRYPQADLPPPHPQARLSLSRRSVSRLGASSSSSVAMRRSISRRWAVSSSAFVKSGPGVASTSSIDSRSASSVPCRSRSRRFSSDLPRALRRSPTRSSWSDASSG